MFRNKIVEKIKIFIKKRYSSYFFSIIIIIIKKKYNVNYILYKSLNIEKIKSKQYQFKFFI